MANNEKIKYIQSYLQNSKLLISNLSNKLNITPSNLLNINKTIKNWSYSETEDCYFLKVKEKNIKIKYVSEFRLEFIVI